MDNNLPFKLKSKDIINFFLKHNKNYSLCKLKDYIKIKYKYKDIYENVKSNKQLSSIIKLRGTFDGRILYHRLKLLLFRNNNVYNKIVGKKLFKKIIELMENGETDKNIYLLIRKINFNMVFMGGNVEDNSNIKYDCNIDFNIKCNSVDIHSENTFYHIFTHIINKNNYQIRNYLDIGCGSCKLTEKLGLKLGLKYKSIYGLDTANFFEQGNWNKKKNLKINYLEVKENEKYPFKENSFYLITCNMVLHHIKDLDFILKEIYRILKKGAFLYIREHDCFSHADKMLFDIEHSMYNYVYSKKIDKNYMNNFYSKYYNFLEWDYILDKYGFKYIHGEMYSKSIYFDVSPNRSFYGIYKKI